MTSTTASSDNTTAPPSIRAFRVADAAIGRTPPGCDPATATTRIHLTAEIVSATVSWSGPEAGHANATPGPSGDLWLAEIGPFGNPGEYVAQATVVDSSGRTTSATVPFSVADGALACPER